MRYDGTPASALCTGGTVGFSPDENVDFNGSGSRRKSDGGRRFCSERSRTVRRPPPASRAYTDVFPARDRRVRAPCRVFTRTRYAARARRKSENFWKTHICPRRKRRRRIRPPSALVSPRVRPVRETWNPHTHTRSAYYYPVRTCATQIHNMCV